MYDKYIVNKDCFKTGDETIFNIYKLLSIGVRCVNYIRSFCIDVRLEYAENVLNNVISPILKKIAYMNDCDDPLFISRKVKYNLYDNTSDEIEIYTFNPKYYNYVGEDALNENRRCLKFINFDDENDMYKTYSSIDERLIIFMHDSEEDILKMKNLMKDDDEDEDDENFNDSYGYELFNIKFNYFGNFNTGKLHSVSIVFESLDDVNHYKGYGHVYCLDCLFHILKYADSEIINTISVNKLF